MPSMSEVMVTILIFVRVSALMILIPVLGHKLVPQPVKAGLSLLLTILLYPMVGDLVTPISPEPLSFILLAIQEILFAGSLALLANLIFAAVQFSGQLMSFQMGLAIANVFDPATNAQGAVTAQLASILAILLWLASGAHHTFILALFDSFALLPVGQPWVLSSWGMLNDAAAQMFILTLRLAAPVMLLLFFVYVALGLMARAVPQIQVFFVSSPLTVGLGLFTFALALPSVTSLTYDAFASLSYQLPAMMRVLAGG